MSTTETIQEESSEEPLAPEQTAEKPAPQKFPPLWRNRDYMLLWSGQVVSAMGTGISQLVIPLLILAITESPALAGYAAAIGTLPYLIFSLPVGALIDRWDRKLVMILSDVGRVVNIASIPIAMTFFELTIWQIYVNTFIEGTLFVFFNIAEVAALPRVVPKGQLPQASAQNEAGFIAAFLAGPPLGGFLFQSVSRAMPFVFDAVSYSASLISLLFIKTKFQEERATITERHLGREIKEGLSWLWRHHLIRYMALLTGANNFVGAALGLILIVIAKELGASEAEIGVMFSISAVGGIVGSVLGGQIQKRFRFGQVIITVGWVSVLLFPLYLLAPNFVVLGIITAFSFMTSPIYNVVQFSYRLALIPDKLQGRVNSTFRLVAFGFQPLGAALAGVLLERVGTFNTVMFYTAWLLFFAILTTLNSHVRNAKPIEEAQAA
ncbi:MAG TPA: MFS transporter [Chloroflexia bacterium]|nr:MFS transporter [Chloroflexia bacterium]